MTGNCPPIPHGLIYIYIYIVYIYDRELAPYTQWSNFLWFLLKHCNYCMTISGSARSSLVFHWLDVESENWPPPASPKFKLVVWVHPCWSQNANIR